MVLGAVAPSVVGRDGLGVGRGLGQADVLADDGLGDELAELGAETVDDLLAEVRAGVDATGDDCGYLELGIEPLADARHGLDQVGHAGQGHGPGLDGDEDLGCGHEGRDGQESHLGAVDEDEVPRLGEFVQGLAEDALGPDLAGQGLLGLDDPGRGGDELDAGGGRVDDVVGQLGFFEEDVVHGPAAVGHAEPRGGAGLGVEVDDEDLLAGLGQGGGQVDGGGGLAAATLLVRYGQTAHNVHHYFTTYMECSMSDTS